MIRDYSGGRLALDDVLSGNADFATVAETPIARAILDGHSPVVVGTICDAKDAAVIVTRKDRGISTADDLRGKRVGLLPGTAADFFLHIYLVTSGIDPGDVIRVPLGSDEIVPALVNGRVDAVSAIEPHTSQLQEALAGEAVVLDQPGLYTLSWNVAILGKTGGPDRTVVVRVLKALARGSDFAASNPTETQAITAKSTGIPVAMLRRQWVDLRWTMELDQSLILSLEDEARWMSGGQATPEFLGFVDTAALRRVRPGSVDIVEPKDR